MRKYFRNVGIVIVGCGLLITLSACSDKASKETPTTPKVTEQSRSNQSPALPASTPGQSSATGAGNSCTALLTTKCTECHNTTRICEKLGKKSKSRWQRTIKRMTERGAKLSGEEADTLLNCLDSNIKELQAQCQ